MMSAFSNHCSLMYFCWRRGKVSSEGEGEEEEDHGGHRMVRLRGRYAYVSYLDFGDYRSRRIWAGKEWALLPRKRRKP